MNLGYILRRNSIVLVFAIMAITLVACGPETLVVGLEPTPTPIPSPTPAVRRYVNGDYGLAFGYPETWALTEEPHTVALRRDNVTLNIAYGWMSSPQFRPLGGRTGMPAGDFIYGGKLFFLGTVLPVRILTFDRVDQMVLYGETSVVEVGDLAFSIWLETVSDVGQADGGIPQGLQAEALEILSSFERMEAAGTPPAPTATAIPTVEREPLPGADKNLTIYANDEYQFAFIYPPSWELQEIPAGQQDSGGGSANAVRLSWEAFRLEIQFKRPAESVVLGSSADSDCPVEELGAVMMLGRSVPRQAQLCQGEITSVFVRDRFDDLELYARLQVVPESQTASEQVTIPEYAQTAMDSVLGSLHRTGESKSFTVENLTYENDVYGFSFQYPASWTVTEVAGQTVEDGVKLADAVAIRQGEFVVVVQYQLTSDSGSVAWGGSIVPGGLGYAEAMLGDQITLLGENTYRHVWTYGGDTKAIAVNTTGEHADLLLSITLSDGTVRIVDDQAATLTESATAALDHVLSTFTLTQ